MPPDAEPYGSGTALVFDTSAWNASDIRVCSLDGGRRSPPGCSPSVRSWRSSCSQARATSKRSATATRRSRRSRRRRSPAAACDRAFGASRELAGERRFPAADYLIAAAAAERGSGVLHYDRHFEPLCRVLGIDSVLIAPQGDLD